jgi:hypothetical protein
MTAEGAGQPVVTNERRVARAEVASRTGLVDVTALAAAAGFEGPVAMTIEAWQEAVAWDTDNLWPEEEATRLWQVLVMARRCLARQGSLGVPSGAHPQPPPSQPASRDHIAPVPPRSRRRTHDAHHHATQSDLTHTSVVVCGNRVRGGHRALCQRAQSLC